MRILVVEDQKKIADFVRKGLEENGYSVTTCSNGEQGFELVMAEPFDAMVLDIMLPGRDGLSILRSLRTRGNNIPVILLTARSELNERVEGLNHGADDYLTKPFYVEELVARLQSLVRRAAGKTASIFQIGDLTLNLATREVRRGEQSIHLTAREFSLLEYLIRSPGRVFTRTQIHTHVWGYHFDPGTNLVDVCIGRLRKKIDGDHSVKLLETLRGVGYRLRDPAAS